MITTEPVYGFRYRGDAERVKINTPAPQAWDLVATRVDGQWWHWPSTRERRVVAQHKGDAPDALYASLATSPLGE